MNGFATGPFLLNLLVTALAVLALMGVTLGVATAVGKQAVVDIVWGPGFALVAVLTYLLSADDGTQPRRLLLTVLTVVWGLRLGGHIFLRNRGRGEDPRYAELMAKAPGNPVAFAFRKVYLTQGAVLWLVSLPVQAGQYTSGGGALSTALLVVGVLVWLVGFAFEAVGDAQLRQFKSDAANQGTVMDRGLWRYTRHPNYFGDACVWWGLFLVSLAHPLILCTVVGPLVMTRLLAKDTGKELTEKHMSRRPGYADYVERTSGFIPMRPKKG